MSKLNSKKCKIIYWASVNINKVHLKTIVVVLGLWEVVYKLYTSIQAVMYNTYLIILSINYNKISSPAVSEKNSVHNIWL